MASMPCAGKQALPEANIRKTKWNIRLDVCSVGIQEYAAEKRPKEPLDHRRRKTGVLKRLERRGFGIVKSVLDRARCRSRTEASHTQFVKEGTDRRKDGAEGRKRTSPRVGQLIEAAAAPHQGTRKKRFQFQCIVVEDSLRFGVTGQEDLKAAIQLEPFHPVGANPPSNAVRLLQNQVP